ncbi:hypothetical protein BD310DRAFT_241950 [Dichomitus squalens]|uniref:Uncharacterized protein n=1 Tax=Dichomitus squalens TaxID=114155 RepID=A0A4Q9PE12_9APHY|nr:hypothetical protein BD310DRAFT_241950 [Dichomitus squalens]
MPGTPYWRKNKQCRCKSKCSKKLLGYDIVSAHTAAAHARHELRLATAQATSQRAAPQGETQQEIRRGSVEPSGSAQTAHEDESSTDMAVALGGVGIGR